MEFTEEEVYYADSTFFDIFTYKVLEGSTDEALDKPNSIVLTETMADRYFGGDAAIGRTPFFRPVLRSKSLSPTNPFCVIVP